MYSFIIIASLAAVALSAPIVEVTQDTEGNYRFVYKTDDATRVEEHSADGHVVGSVEYRDPDGVLRTLQYTSGPEGYHATGPLIPVFDNTPIDDTPEVAEAKEHHLRVFKVIDSSLPRLNPDGLVDEVPEVPLSKDEFLAAVSAVLGNGPLVFSDDTPEIAAAKSEHFKAVSEAL